MSAVSRKTSCLTMKTRSNDFPPGTRREFQKFRKILEWKDATAAGRRQFCHTHTISTLWDVPKQPTCYIALYRIKRIFLACHPCAYIGKRVVWSVLVWLLMEIYFHLLNSFRPSSVLRSLLIAWTNGENHPKSVQFFLFKLLCVMPPRERKFTTQLL